ncbi:eRF1 domain 1-domain-containing protein [Paraphoma chrysanthemicola]|uniref:Protein DOM34 homolog n=1 Tax=Paraphoma chrysanthemicola TaxID=798071 RepID=A0A8K0W2L3_9PLEO|nr:eRF1 domain 1-domain-containing protein [Paraphoma chrysanthemicola]
MRLLKSQIEQKTGAGFATLMPEEPEDMWHAYNLIQEHDRIRAKAVRRVSKISDSGSTSSQRIALDLTIAVTSTDFDIASGQLHVSGKVASENEHVKMGQHHTLDLELNRKFTIEKADGWDSIALEMLKEACDTDRRAELWAIVLGEGTANICMITEHQTILRQRIEVPVPRKRKGGADGHIKGMDKFFATTLSTLLRQIDLTGTQNGKTLPLLLASPGFVAQAFLQYMKAEATRTTNKPLLALVPSVIIAHASSAHVHALSDILSSPAITTKLSDTKYARETALMDKFTTLMRQDDGRAWYGPREVERAVDRGGVGRGGGVLMINNALFRAQNVAERRRWVKLVDRVREVEGGEVRVFSSLHESGKRLEGLGGVAAILTYPIEDLDEEGEDEGVVEGEGEMIV